MVSRMVIGTDYSDGNLVIGRGVRPKVGGAGYDSTIGSGLHRSALVIGASGTDGPALRWRTAVNSSAALGTSVTMTDVLSVVGTTASINGNARISNGALYLTQLAADEDGSACVYFGSETTSSGVPISDGVVIKYTGNNFGENTTSVDGLIIEKTDTNHVIPDGGIAFTRRGSEGVRVYDLMIRDGRVGIGVTAPAVSLDVAGTIRASSGIRFGTDTSAANTLSDYEEGSYTATVQYSTTLTSTSPTSTTTITAHYVKVGKLVTVFTPQITRDGTFSGSDVIVNTISLPFASGGYNEVGTVGGYRVRGQYSTSIANYGEHMFSYASGSLGIVRMLSNTASGDAYYPRLDRANSNIQMTMTYRTA